MLIFFVIDFLGPNQNQNKKKTTLQYLNTLTNYYYSFFGIKCYIDDTLSIQGTLISLNLYIKN